MHLRVSSSANRPAVGGEAIVGSLAGFNGFIGLGANRSRARSPHPRGWRWVAAFLGMVSDAFAATVPHG